MTKCIVRGHKKGLVDQCFGDVVTHNYVMKKFKRTLRAEVKCMCSSKVDSVLQKRSYDELKSFKWQRLISELEVHAPTLLSILNACTTGTQQPRENRVSVVGMCCAMILKLHYSRMSLVQKIIATILQAGHCNKQVFSVISIIIFITSF